MSKARNLANLLTDGKVEADDLNVGQLGGRRNLIINGGFDVWQRGTSFSNAWNYGADRWVHSVDSARGVSSTEGTYTTTTGTLFQAIELPSAGNNYPFVVGQQVTVSMRVRSTSRIRPYFAFRNGVVGADNGFTSDTIEYKGGSGSWETVSWTVTVSATCGGSDNCLSLSFSLETAGTSTDITQVQLELGSVATPFEHRSYGEELALCQRYYQRVSNEGKPYGRFGVGQVTGSTTASFIYPFPVKMRSTPSLTTNGNSANYGIYTRGLLSTATSGPNIDGVGSSTNIGVFNMTSSGLTAGDGAEAITTGTTALVYLAWDSEL